MDDGTRAGRREAAWMRYFAIGCFVVAGICAVGFCFSLFYGQLGAAFILLVMGVTSLICGAMMNIASAAQYNIWREDDPMG